MTRRVLGVLGGMGPAATVDFLAKLQAATPAASDADHIRVVMDLNPRVPDRHADPEGAGAELGSMAARLRDLGAEVLAMPCNTAHQHRTEIEAASGLTLIDMVAETARAAVEGGARTVGVLATPGGERLYAAALETAGAAMVIPTDADRARLMGLIKGVKAGDLGTEARAGMAALAGLLVQRGAQTLIAGCTEVPLLLDRGNAPAPLWDSTEVLARRCVAVCGAGAA